MGINANIDECALLELTVCRRTEIEDVRFITLLSLLQNV